MEQLPGKERQSKVIKRFGNGSSPAELGRCRSLLQLQRRDLKPLHLSDAFDAGVSCLRFDFGGRIHRRCSKFVTISPAGQMKPEGCWAVVEAPARQLGAAGHDVETHFLRILRQQPSSEGLIGLYEVKPACDCCHFAQHLSCPKPGRVLVINRRHRVVYGRVKKSAAFVGVGLSILPS